LVNQIYNEDSLTGMAKIPDGTVDLIVADPPYRLGKDYGNDSDKLEIEDYLVWSKSWIDIAIPKLKADGSFYVFLTWRHSPEILSYMKKQLIMLNEIIWDRKVPSMGGSTRRFSSVHDTIGFFAKSKDYYFDIDSIRIPYDAETKKARSRSIFAGKKWLEVGYNPKDVWSISRLHAIHSEREDHPTQKPLEVIERMVKASCPVGGLVLDPFMGSGTTAVAAKRLGRRFVGFEINADYFGGIEKRLLTETTPFETQVQPANSANHKQPALDNCFSGA
jgi:site-specific DNA-methyltransferase (adenine-specific)